MQQQKIGKYVSKIKNNKIKPALEFSDHIY